MSGPSCEDTSRFLRTELLERIAHELRGPAGVTLGALDELEHALSSSDAAQNRVLFAMARRGARRVLRTAERLTRTAQLESGELEIACAPEDVRSVVRRAAEDAELVEGRSSVKVTLSLPPDPAVAEIDGGWLGLAVGEMVSAAIRCARRSVCVRVEPVDEAVRVLIEDDRSVAMDAPNVRFVSQQDRRDAALGWPLVCDVARAHRAELSQEILRRDGGGAVSGLRVALALRASA